MFESSTLRKLKETSSGALYVCVGSGIVHVCALMYCTVLDKWGQIMPSVIQKVILPETEAAKCFKKQSPSVTGTEQGMMTSKTSILLSSI